MWLRDELGSLYGRGFGQAAVARLLGISVAALRAGEYAENGEPYPPDVEDRLSSLYSSCLFLDESYQLDDVAVWFETPILPDAPVTPIDLWVGGRMDLLFAWASGLVLPAVVLTAWDPEWWRRCSSDFEAFTAADGCPSLRPRDVP